MSRVLEFVGRLPWWLQVGIVVVLLVVGFYLFGQVQSCGYHKGRTDFEARDKARELESVHLKARAEAAEQRVAELEPKAAAFDAVAEQHIKADKSLAEKVGEVSKEAANEEARADQPTDCRVRAQRVCDLLSANRIKHDCAAITRETCHAAGQ